MHQISNIYFVIKLYMFWASSVPIIRRYLLYARQLVCFMQAMWPLPSRERLELWSQSLHGTYQLPCVQEITPDDGHRRCPKHVEFYDKINVGYSMHLVGCFMWRMYLPQGGHEVVCLPGQNAGSHGHWEVLLEDSECHPASQEPGSQLLEKDQHTTYKCAHCIFCYCPSIRTIKAFNYIWFFHCNVKAII